MVYYFQDIDTKIYFVESDKQLTNDDIQKLTWLFGGSKLLDKNSLEGKFIGPRKEMITPWSTNAVEITQNMGIKGLTRIETFYLESSFDGFDPMIHQKYQNLDEKTLLIDAQPKPIIEISDIKKYNEQEGLALSGEEIEYLNKLSERIGRKLTDSEVFGFSQVNSEHCRHKIFNGIFEIDGKEMQDTLFQLIRKTSNLNKNRIVSAYSDNVAFVEGPKAVQFAPKSGDKMDYFEEKDIDTVISLKAETHNFPTTVEPFNGAATGSGGEIRDRMAGGKGSIPMAGTAVYMTPYTRLEEGRAWEKHTEPRQWLYQNPIELLIKASNGASDFGNKFGQPLICGSVMTYEFSHKDLMYAYDKVIMLAGGVGYAKTEDAHKEEPKNDAEVIVMGGDNYRIGMGGGAVSSVATGEFKNSIELNAVQRSNPEMQKRAFNAIRALSEMDKNPIISIHDHGAGGHLNSLSELVETSGGKIDIDKLPVGDSTLSSMEILGNESQERMGLLMNKKNLKLLEDISRRERAPYYNVGHLTGDMRLQFTAKEEKELPFDLDLVDLFGNPPQTILKDNRQQAAYENITYDKNKLYEYLTQVLQLETVACKDWLTNKVDRSVTSKIALQQNAGVYHLPINNLGVVAIDYKGKKGIATSIGHASVPALIDSKAGSRLAVAEALTNVIWAPIEEGLKGISLSANWMWPAKNKGENARLYDAVKAISDFAIELGINIPTGKDSLSMTQKYSDDKVVYSPGTVIVSSVGEVKDIRKVVTPVLKKKSNSYMYHIDLSGVDSTIDASAFATVFGKLGNNPPTVKDAKYLCKAFDVVQKMIEDGKILAGHDISSGGKITTLLEMCFVSDGLGMQLNIEEFSSDDIRFLFSENPGIVVQVDDCDYFENSLKSEGIGYNKLGKVVEGGKVEIKGNESDYQLDIDEYRRVWYKSSFLLDSKQTPPTLAKARFDNYEKQKLEYVYPKDFKGSFEQYPIPQKDKRVAKAAIIREKGINGDREMAYSLYLAGFDVKDVHMTDLVSGRETLEDVNMIVFPGGFSNSDVLGSSKGWAGAFLYNDKAKTALKNFYNREDTLSLGVCNGCQLMAELDLIYPDLEKGPRLLHNDSKKFESAFLTVDVLPSNSVMLESLAGTKLGIWIAHGEGKFGFPSDKESDYNIPMKYAYDSYPGNPNGSQFNTAAICSKDGRHLAMMPHLERAILPWQWAHLEDEHAEDELSPWVEAFVNARKWVEKKINS